MKKFGTHRSLVLLSVVSLAATLCIALSMIFIADSLYVAETVPPGGTDKCSLCEAANREYESTDSMDICGLYIADSEVATELLSGGSYGDGIFWVVLPIGIIAVLLLAISIMLFIIRKREGNRDEYKLPVKEESAEAAVDGETVAAEPEISETEQEDEK